MLAALAFSGDESPLANLGGKDWEEALAFCDRNQLTLLLGALDTSAFPVWVRRRLETNLADNAVHTGRVTEALRESCDALRAAGVEFVVLKGLTQAPHFVEDLRLRATYDLDFYCLREHLPAAWETLARLGYEPANPENAPTDHLPTLIRRSGWQWKGNWFDPGMPIAVDLHFRFWDEETERFAAPGIDEFWDRRTTANAAGLALPVLEAADALAYCCLHMLRHVLRGSLRLCHAREVAFFLHCHADDIEFWEHWSAVQEPALRRLEAICFRLAVELFGCRVAAAAEEEISNLPADIALWFEKYAASPVEAMFRPRKDEIWLHMCLLGTHADKLRVLRRRLLPTHIPPPREAGSAPRGPLIARAARYAVFLASRASYHARAALPAVWRGLTWKRSAAGLGAPFWTFLGAASLFNFGLFVFQVLFNLRLLDLGFREDVMGRVAGAFTAGCLAGALPAGVLLERLGLSKAVRLCFAGAAAASLARSLVTNEPALLVGAFLGGLAMSLWAVAIPPAVTQLTDERTRPLGFSMVFGAGIGMGVLGGLAAGHLPRWMAGTGTGGALPGNQAALLVACACMLLAAVPAGRLRFGTAPARGKAVFPRSRFVVRFLLVLAVWSAATGSFNPFFNAYFAVHLRAPVERIGSVFAASQFAQMLTVLCAPLVLKRAGLIRGITLMQLATAGGLAALAVSVSGTAAALAYAAYMSFQYMSEPGMYSLLMNRVGAEERGGASSLNFFVIFSAQALAAAASGAALTRFGYPAVLGGAAVVAALAAVLFLVLLRGFDRAPAS